MPWMKVRSGSDDKPVCVYKQDTDGKPEGESLGCHENDEKADAQIAALHAQESNMTHQFLFTELNADALRAGQFFDGLAPGKFTDMHGQAVVIEPGELQTYIRNTQTAIEAARSESGEVVGLPIDAHGHDKGDGAGWIVGVELKGGLVRLLP